ncbi:DsbA family protein [Paenibacillus sacheonensis]|uniref:Thioredoxin domain-containing protein n=1 Tax=Paenibacillus sacheonensis TaxID=742054 RepID=A0A7X4YKV8_9BACL|nr:DsbA family protein [Paenibacillus sacheonensis]MBM7563285.1 protein-disulfide isomerase [Paenibacillus sacheonensis]NBC68157.1 thioredoxin domain-containing protein [Paenibacillus sacheonensis]
MTQPVKKSTYKSQRRAEQEKLEKQRKTTRKLIWITAAVVVLGIIAAVIFTPRSNPTDFDYAKLPVLGKADAPVKIVEFGDYKCPSCQVFSQQVKPLLEKDYIDTGKVALYFKDFAFIGPDSFTAAGAAHSVFHQSNDAFWKYYDALYKNQPDEKTLWATSDYLVQLAKDNDIGVDLDQLKKDIDGKTYEKDVKKSNSDANKAHVQSTPTLFINGKEFTGSFASYAQLKQAIDKELAAGQAE